MQFPRIPRRFWQSSLIALILFAAAAALRLAVLGGLGSRIPYVTFFPAVMLAVLWSGLCSGLLVSALSAVYSLYWSMEPIGSFAAHDSADLLGLAVFLTSCAMVGALSEFSRRNQRRASEAEAQIRLVSERTQSDLALAQSEENFRSYFDNSPIAVFVVDGTGRYVNCNPAAVELLGYSLEQLRALRVPELHPVEDQPGVLEQFAALKGAGSISLEARLLRADGEPVWVSLRAVLLADGHGIAYCQDITEQRQAEQNLRERLALREQLALVAATVPGVIHSFRLRADGTSCFPYASAALEQLYGVRPEDVALDAQPVLDRLNPDDRDAVLRSIALSARTLSPWQQQFRIQHPRRGTIWVEGYSVPQREADGSTLWHGYLQDVTSRRLSEQALRSSSQFNRQIVDSAQEGIVVYGPDLRYQVWNHYLETLTGLPAREVLGRHPQEVVPCLGPPEVMELLGRTLSGEAGSALEFCFPYPHQGRTCWVSHSFAPLRSAQGRIIGVIGIVRDITDRKGFEKELRASEARFRTLVEQAGDAFFVHDQDGRFLDVNRRACDSLGYQPEELLQLGVGDIEADLELDRLRESWDRMQPGQQLTIRGRQRRKGGSTFPVEVRLGCYQQNEERFYLGLARDITGRERREELLREASRRMELATTAGGFGVWDLDVPSGTLVWNDRMFELYGIEPTRAELRRETWVESLHPADRERVLAASVATLEHGAPFDLEFRVLHPDGRIKSIKAHAVVVRDAQGQPLRMIGLNADVTEQRSLEAQLFQAQKMEAVGRLAGGVAHDFNNNLTVILGYAELSRLVGVSSDTFHEYLGEIIKAAEHSRDITQQLLAFSRNEIIAPRQVELNQLIQRTEKTLVRLIGEDVRLRFSTQDTWPVLIDPAQVNQIIINLAVNARDAMPGGGTLSIETRNLRLDQMSCLSIPDAKPGEYVQLTVSDTGIGMDRELQNHIFEPFFTTKGIGKGTGLGLATVYGIVRQNDGFIQVCSEPGSGASFSLCFPRLVQEGGAEAQPEPQPALGEGVVLLVEDEVTVRQMVQLMLETAGYAVLVADSPADALVLCRRPGQHVDCLLTDVIMPDMNGVELSAAVRELRPELAVVYMSGYTADMIAHHGVLSREVCFLQKPFDLNSLNAKLQAALSQNR
jgi:PAS domain S-box-containing protein